MANETLQQYCVKAASRSDAAYEIATMFDRLTMILGFFVIIAAVIASLYLILQVMEKFGKVISNADKIGSIPSNYAEKQRELEEKVESLQEKLDEQEEDVWTLEE